MLPRMSILRKTCSLKPINADAALLVLRLGVGLSLLLFHGYGKITAGPESWAGLGKNMAHVGISFLPAFWGFMAAFAESFGSLFLVLGVFFRPAAALLAMAMFVAAARHLGLPADESGAGWRGASHALEILAVSLCLLLAGPGRYTLAMLWSPAARQ